MPRMLMPAGSHAPNQVSDMFSPVPLEGAGAAMGGLMGAMAPAMGGMEDYAGGALNGLKRLFTGGATALPEIDTTLPRLGESMAPKVGYQTIGQPKPGGVLSEVLGRAGEKSGMGLPTTTGEGRLLAHYSKLIR